MAASTTRYILGESTLATLNVASRLKTELARERDASSDARVREAILAHELRAVENSAAETESWCARRVAEMAAVVDAVHEESNHNRQIDRAQLHRERQQHKAALAHANRSADDCAVLRAELHADDPDTVDLGIGQSVPPLEDPLAVRTALIEAAQKLASMRTRLALATTEVTRVNREAASLRLDNDRLRALLGR